MVVGVTTATAAEPPVLSLADAARYLGISRATAYRLAAADKFPVPVLRVSARRLVVSTARLHEYVNGGAA